MVNTNLISSYRRELMAVAMFAILLTHMNCDFGCFAINRLALCGQGGVDAFFFLSGFGMYYSGMKKTTLTAFYKKRAVRIFPSFLAIFGIYMYIKHSFSWQRLFWGGSTLAYWFPATRKYMFGWFVSAIVLLYALFPFYFKWFKQQRWVSTLCGIGVGLVLTGLYAYYFLVLHPGGYNQYVLTTSRIPIFFVGIGYAWFLNNQPMGCKTHYRRTIEIVVASIAFIAYNTAIDHWGFMNMRNSGMLYLPFLLIVPGACSLLGLCFETLSRFSLGKMVLKTLQQAGTCTLEAYLLIGVTYGYSTMLCHSTGMSVVNAKIVIAVATILLAWTIHKLVSLATKFLKIA